MNRGNLPSSALKPIFEVCRNIVSSVCKYRIRLQSFGNNDLLFHALESQNNSHKTLTYEDFSINMLHTLGLIKQNIPTLQIN